MVIGYKAHWLTAWMARRLTEVPYVAQPNLILDRMAFPELLQEECTAPSLVDHATPLFDPESTTGKAQRVALAEVKARVGGPGAGRRPSRSSWWTREVAGQRREVAGGAAGRRGGRDLEGACGRRGA